MFAKTELNQRLRKLSRTHFLSFSFILIVYLVLESFSLNATLISTFNNNNNLKNNNNSITPT